MLGAVGPRPVLQYSVARNYVCDLGSLGRRRRLSLALRMQTIVTPTLTLEPLLASHAEAMFELLSDRAIYQYLDYSPPASVEYLRGVYLRLEARRSPDGSEAWLNWVIRPRDQPLVGYVQATVASDRGLCRVCSCE